MGVSIVYWRKGLNYYSLLLLCLLNIIPSTLCLVVCLIVDILLRWVFCVLTSIMLPGIVFTFSFSPVAFSYIVKALVFKVLYN